MKKGACMHACKRDRMIRYASFVARGVILSPPDPPIINTGRDLDGARWGRGTIAIRQRRAWWRLTFDKNMRATRCNVVRDGPAARRR